MCRTEKGGHPENPFEQAGRKPDTPKRPQQKHVHLLYEAGTSAPPFGIVCRMADLYHCSPADFRLMEYRPK